MYKADDQGRKRAIKRLKQDLEELHDSPVENVSAIPLESDIFEWHCNVNVDNITYHLILFFPDNYPHDSPSAELIPLGFRLSGRATEKGTKGICVFLSILSNSAEFHTEWANEKSAGWSPGYTATTVLHNIVSYLKEMNEDSEASSDWEYNRKLATTINCRDCGHTAKKPFPELQKPVSDEKHSVESTYLHTAVIIDHISKQQYNPNKTPTNTSDLYGYGVVVSGSKYKPNLTTSCEFLTGESYSRLRAGMEREYSMLKAEPSVFLPMFLHENHGSQIKSAFEVAMRRLKFIIPDCWNASTEEIILRTLPNLMNTTVVEFSNGTQHTSDNHLIGYFALHQLFLWAIDTYPTLQGQIDSRLQEFIVQDEKRNKKSCPNIGEWLILLSGSFKYTWTDAADAYLSENRKRNVMWYVKNDSSLGDLDTDMEYRLDKTFKATLVSRKVLAFQVMFLDIAMPSKWTRDKIIARYNETMGFPTPKMLLEMKDALAKIDSMQTYDDYYQVLKLNPPTNDTLYDQLVQAVVFAINTEGYKFSSGLNQGGWATVLARYPRGIDVAKFQSNNLDGSGCREKSSSRYQRHLSGHHEIDSSCHGDSTKNRGGDGSHRGGGDHQIGSDRYRRGSENYKGDRGYQCTRDGSERDRGFHREDSSYYRRSDRYSRGSEDYDDDHSYQGEKVCPEDIGHQGAWGRFQTGRGCQREDSGYSKGGDRYSKENEAYRGFKSYQDNGGNHGARGGYQEVRRSPRRGSSYHKRGDIYRKGSENYKDDNNHQGDRGHRVDRGYQGARSGLRRGRGSHREGSSNHSSGDRYCKGSEDYKDDNDYQGDSGNQEDRGYKGARSGLQGRRGSHREGSSNHNRDDRYCKESEDCKDDNDYQGDSDNHEERGYKGARSGLRRGRGTHREGSSNHSSGDRYCKRSEDYKDGHDYQGNKGYQEDTTYQGARGGYHGGKGSHMEGSSYHSRGDRYSEGSEDYNDNEKGYQRGRGYQAVRGRYQGERGYSRKASGNRKGGDRYCKENKENQEDKCLQEDSDYQGSKGGYQKGSGYRRYNGSQRRNGSESNSWRS